MSLYIKQTSNTNNKNMTTVCVLYYIHKFVLLKVTIYVQIQIMDFQNQESLLYKI